MEGFFHSATTHTCLGDTAWELGTPIVSSVGNKVRSPFHQAHPQSTQNSQYNVHLLFSIDTHLTKENYALQLEVGRTASAWPIHFNIFISILLCFFLNILWKNFGVSTFFNQVSVNQLGKSLETFATSWVSIPNKFNLT